MGVLRRLQARPDATSTRADGGDPLAPLMVRAGRGDQAAFGDLYDALSGLVYGIVRNIVRDPSQSEEVTQEVFVEVWRLAPRFDETRGSVNAWVGTVAHRRAVDRVRSEQSSRDRLERDQLKQEPASDVVADTVVDAHGREYDRRRVRRALDRLTDVQREAVELAYFGGHTYREVAALLDQPEGTIKTRIRDAMIRLRDELGASE